MDDEIAENRLAWMEGAVRKCAQRCHEVVSTEPGPDRESAAIRVGVEVAALREDMRRQAAAEQAACAAWKAAKALKDEQQSAIESLMRETLLLEKDLESERLLRKERQNVASKIHEIADTPSKDELIKGIAAYEAELKELQGEESQLVGRISEYSSYVLVLEQVIASLQSTVQTKQS